MGMNESELEAVVGELQRLVGVSTSGVWQPSRDRVILGFQDGTWLLLVPRGPLARAHTVTRRPKNPQKPFSFQGACRSRIRGPLTALHKVQGERVVRLEFGSVRLELRLTGRSGGLWLVEGDHVVAAYDGPAPEALPPLAIRPVRDDESRFLPVEGSWDLGARRYFGDLDRERATVDLRADVERRLRRAISRTDRLRLNLEGDLIRAEQAPALRRQADLLAANLHRVPRGAERVELDDWEGGTVVVELEPGRPATATLEQLYRRAGRLDRVGDRVLERMDEVEAELVGLQRAMRDLASASLETLQELDRTLPRGSSGRSRPDDLPWVTWTGPRGERVLVGRNERGNRRLTFQVARGDDWWMHLRARPGAHVILPMPRGQSPSLPLLLAAAQIVLAHAKIPEGEPADVQYARVRDVRAIPGETARVRVADERVLRVVRDPSELSGWIREDLTTGRG